MSILTVNIDGVSDKLENILCIEFLSQYDIVFLNEIKCSYPLKVPGFEYVRSSVVKGEELRGGSAVLIKHHLWLQMFNVQLYKDQVWFSLNCVYALRFGAVYIAPIDSPYYDPISFSRIREECVSNPRVIIAGDINARLSDLQLKFGSPEHGIYYSKNVDPCPRAKTNAGEITNVCQEFNLKPVNHLQFNEKHFPGNLTFKKKSQWISQLDWMICDTTSLPCIRDFQVLQKSCLPTDHAALSLTLECSTPAQAILDRASDLGQSVQPRLPKHTAVSVKSIDLTQFTSNLPNPALFWQNPNDIDSSCKFITEGMHSAALSSRLSRKPIVHPNRALNAQERWKNILLCKDSRKIWQSINWKGTFSDIPCNVSTPSDNVFCEFFTQLLNDDSDVPTPLVVPHTDKYNYELDKEFDPAEIENAIKDLKSNKAAGVDGIPPGLLKSLPDEWLLMITFLFNSVFSGSYPLCWALAKMFLIFKKGERLLPSNYRGISVVNALPKLYDMVLNVRFMKWYSPSPEQSGAQKGRSCEEQILVVRLLIDVARKLNLPLYFGCVDFCKAYDTVNRSKLLELLDAAGCSKKFLNAIANTLRHTCSQIGSCFFTSSKGVRQGGPMSCSLFTFYVDGIIKAIKDTGEDGWLGPVHCLMQMDDSIILATSRARFIEKLRTSKSISDILNQEMHPVKSRFLTVNVNDKEPIVMDNIVIKHVDIYEYLGTPLSNSSISEQASNHISMKNGCKLKFFSFLNKNSSAPFEVKEKVWSSALLSSIFYSCETWLGCSQLVIRAPYLETLKRLLSVRTTTVNEVSMIEAGVSSASVFVAKRQRAFLQRLFQRRDFNSSYVGWAVTKAINAKSPMGRCIANLRNGVLPCDSVMLGKVRESNTTKRMSYCELNPDLSRHPMYTNSHVPEYARISMTRMRLSSHSLRIETGRWSRLDRNNRVCICDNQSVQDEVHVLFYCPMSAHIRYKYPEFASLTSMKELFSSEKVVKCALFCHEILKCYA